MRSFLRAARRALDEDMSAGRKETEETLSLLKDTAQKHMQAESSKGGVNFRFCLPDSQSEISSPRSGHRRSFIWPF
jgi:hypothetical protein